MRCSPWRKRPPRSGGWNKSMFAASSCSRSHRRRLPIAPHDLSECRLATSGFRVELGVARLQLGHREIHESAYARRFTHIGVDTHLDGLDRFRPRRFATRSEAHTSELLSLIRSTY